MQAAYAVLRTVRDRDNFPVCMGIVPCDMQILCRDVSFILLIIVKAAELKKWSENENRAEIEQKISSFFGGSEDKRIFF